MIHKYNSSCYFENLRDYLGSFWRGGELVWRGEKGFQDDIWIEQLLLFGFLFFCIFLFLCIARILLVLIPNTIPCQCTFSFPFLKEKESKILFWRDGESVWKGEEGTPRRYYGYNSYCSNFGFTFLSIARILFVNTCINI